MVNKLEKIRDEKAGSSDIDHDATINTHNLTTDIDHDTITNTHNLTTDIDHDTITNTHNLTTDIDHVNILNIGSNTHAQIDTHLALTSEHIDWTNATDNLTTTGDIHSASIENPNATLDIQGDTAQDVDVFRNISPAIPHNIDGRKFSVYRNAGEQLGFWQVWTDQYRRQIINTAFSQLYQIAGSTRFTITTGLNTHNSAVEIAYGADPLLTLDQSSSDEAFIDFQGATGNNYEAPLSCNQGDGDVVGPRAPDTQDGWAFFDRMVKVKICGSANEYYMAVYQPCEA